MKWERKAFNDFYWIRTYRCSIQFVVLHLFYVITIFLHLFAFSNEKVLLHKFLSVLSRTQGLFLSFLSYVKLWFLSVLSKKTHFFLSVLSKKGRFLAYLKENTYFCSISNHYINTHFFHSYFAFSLIIMNYALWIMYLFS